MCMSPHEMKSARIEEIVQQTKERLKLETDRWYIQYYTGRIGEFEKLLKERADDGTYATAGI